MTELTPCPCGGKPVHDDNDYEGIYQAGSMVLRHQVHCDTCVTTTKFYPTSEEAAIAWNLRIERHGGKKGKRK